MDAFEGTFHTPKAHEVTKQRIKILKVIPIALIASIVMTGAVLFFILKTNTEFDQRILIGVLVLDVVVIGCLSLMFKKMAERLERVVDRVRGQEVIFFKDRIELAGTTFTHPNPKAALESQNPYLRVHFRDIESVRVFPAQSKVPAHVRITLMNDKSVSVTRNIFAGVEPQFLDALRSHGVNVSLDQ